MTVKVARDDMTARDLRAAAGRVKDGKVARRMLAIALILEGASRKVAAESCGMDRQTLRDWVHRYNDEGIEGLANRGGGGMKPRLTPDQMARLSAWVEAGPDPERDGVVRWRRADLARRIATEFGIELHERTVGTYLAKLGFRRLSVRPEHPNADPAAQVAFKKLRGYRNGHPAGQGKGKTPGNMVSRRGKGRPAGNTRPHLGKAWHRSACTPRYTLQIELHLWRRLPGAGSGRRAGPSLRRC
jgi:transposase